VPVRWATTHGHGQVKSKEGEPIHVGDTVETKFRGGHREGKVQAIYTDSASEPAEGDAEDVNIRVQHPPKVVMTDQHGHQVNHNPNTLTKTD